MRILRVLLVAAVVLASGIAAQADTVLGVPVTGVGGTQAVPTCGQGTEGSVCYNAGTGQIGFFIPLRPQTSGIYGVTSVPGGTSGTFSDTGYGTSNALTMFLMFAPVNLPVQSANLTLSFIDLDLIGVNDPAKFFETIQFFSQSGTPLTPLITTVGQTGNSGGGGPVYYVWGNSTTQTIYFPDVTTLMTDPFYIQLNFGSQWNQKGTNTVENLTATLQTTPLPPPPPPPTQVPEPGTMLLLGSGLAGTLLRAIRRS